MPVPVRTTAWAQASMDDKECPQRLGSLPHTETMPANLGSQDLVPTLRCYSHREPHVSLSLYFQLLAVIQIIKTNHTKLDPARSFFPQPTSWVRVGGRGGQRHWEEMKIGPGGRYLKERNKLSAPLSLLPESGSSP